MVGRLSCLLGWHHWEQHTASGVSGNAVYWLCSRCRRERATPRAEDFWGMASIDRR